MRRSGSRRSLLYRPPVIVVGGNDAYTSAWDAQVQSNGGSAVSSTQKGYVDTLVTSLKSNFGATLETTFLRVWLLANFDNNEHASFTSLINPSSTEMTKSGSFTSTTLGYLSNGTTGFIDSHFTPSTDGISSSAAYTLGFYVCAGRTVSDSTIALGAYDGSKIDQILPLFSTAPNAFMGTLSSAIAGVSNQAAGLHVCARVSSTNARYDVHLHAGSTHGTSTNVGAHGGLVPRKYYICARNNDNTADSFSTDKLAFAFIANTGFSTTNSDNLFSAVDPYMGSLGIQV